MSFSVYLITPDASAATAERVRVALTGAEPGAVAVQLRDKGASREAFTEAARALRAITRAAGAPLYINADIEVAETVGADGVHLPEAGPTIHDVPAGLSVGCSRHDRGGLRSADHEGAHFATLAPVGAVPGKGPPIGLDGFAAAIADLALPVYALGGVGPADAAPLVRRGAAGVAVIRAVFDADDPAEAVAALCAATSA